MKNERLVKYGEDIKKLESLRDKLDTKRREYLEFKNIKALMIEEQKSIRKEMRKINKRIRKYENS